MIIILKNNITIFNVWVVNLAFFILYKGRFFMSG